MRKSENCPALKMPKSCVLTPLEAWAAELNVDTTGWMTPAEPARPDALDKFLRPPNITTPFNIGGQPAMNIPCGFSAEGLPLSLQLAAAHFEEALLFRSGHAYQQLTDWHTRRPTQGLIQ